MIDVGGSVVADTRIFDGSKLIACSSSCQTVVGLLTHKAHNNGGSPFQAVSNATKRSVTRRTSGTCTGSNGCVGVSSVGNNSSRSGFITVNVKSNILGIGGDVKMVTVAKITTK